MEEVLAYCVKEKAQKPMKDPTQVTLKNGKLAMQGVCSSCGTKMMKFISAKKAVSSPATTPASNLAATGPAVTTSAKEPMKEAGMARPMATPAPATPVAPKA